MTWLGWVANGIGATVVFIAVGFLLGVFFDEQQRAPRRDRPGPASDLIPHPG